MVSSASEAEAFAFAGFSLDPRQRLLFGPDGHPVPLTPRAFDTLLYLVEHPNELIDRQTLMKAVWPNVIVEDNNLDKQITLLRKALGESPGDHRFVVTIPGRGFRFVPAVQREQSASEQTARPTQGSPRLAPRFHRISRFPAGKRAGIIALLLLAGVGPVWLLVRWQETGVKTTAAQSVTGRQIDTVASAIPTSAGTPLYRKPRIAILPFVNLSPDPANAFFTDGLHEEILATLAARAPGLEVISRTTMMTYRTPQPVEAIARELGATHVLEGSVRREGNEVRLTLQLIDAKTDQHLWSQDYDRTLKNALTLQSEVAAQVASQLAVQINSGGGVFNAPTRDPEAFDLWLKANLYWHSNYQWSQTPLDTFLKWQGYLDAAIARDPGFAEAYAERSTARYVRFIFNRDPPGILDAARADLAVAERLAPNDPRMLLNKAVWQAYIDRNLPGALNAYDAAMAAGLSDPTLLSVSMVVLRFADRLDESIQDGERALTLDPKNPIVFGYLIGALVEARQAAEALRIAKLADSEYPERFGATEEALRWYYTGSPRALSTLGARVDQSLPKEITAGDALGSVTSILNVMRWQHRYPAMVMLLNKAASKTIRSDLECAGDEPVAGLRGWADLLAGNRAAAAQDGREVLDFIAHRPETKWNRVLLRRLTAEGNLFLGDKARALAAARETLRIADWPEDKDYERPSVAAVYAWAGAMDEATTLLEQLSTDIPQSVSWVEIARDPLYGVPLAGNARYQALQTRLEALMAATKLE